MEKETRIFEIEVDGEPMPVRYREDILDHFERTYADEMDREIRTISDREFGPSFYLTRMNRLGVLAPVLHEAVEERDRNRIILCVLWLATRFPEVTGVEVHDHDLQFLWDDDTEPTLPFDRPRFLN